MDNETRRQHLVSGYVRSEFLIIQNEDMSFEMLLPNIMLKFLGNIFIAFDRFHWLF